MIFRRVVAIYTGKNFQIEEDGQKFQDGGRRAKIPRQRKTGKNSQIEEDGQKFPDRGRQAKISRQRKMRQRGTSHKLYFEVFSIFLATYKYLKPV